MEKKLKVADFAALLGIVPKTVYKMIEREEIVTVTEKVNNRLTTLVVTSDAQINELKKIYCKEQVNNGNYYENVTDNNHSVSDIESHSPVKTISNNEFASEVIDRIVAINEGYNEQLKEYNEQLKNVNEELVTAKSKVLFLEDKAGREGLYLNEINGLKTDVNRLRKVIYGLLLILVVVLLGLTAYITYNVAVNNSKEKVTEPVIEVPLRAQPQADTKKAAQGIPAPRKD